MLNLVCIFLGGALGSVLRVLVTKALVPVFFSFGTFVVNIVGCFLLGMFSVLSQKRGKYIPKHYRLALTSGLCGGLTTFSTFSYEVIFYFQNGMALKAISYLSLSLVLGVLAVYFGIETCRVLLKLHIDMKRAKLRQEFLEGE